MKLGIFDSGIGGISVLNEAFHQLRDVDFVFYADVDHVPYGLKTPEEIKGYADRIIAELISRDVDAVLIACNTATAVAANYVREKYDVPIIGMEPAVKPAVETAADSNGRVLVMATPVTIRENKLHKLLEKVDKSHMVDLLPMPGLVRFAESEIFDTKEVADYIEEQLAVFDKMKYTDVVLGCTHFNYFKPAIRAAFESAGVSVRLIDGNAGTIKHVADILRLESVEKELSVEELEELNSRTIYLESGRDTLLDADKYARLHARLEKVREI